MKNKILSLLMIISLASCATLDYYQVYKADIGNLQKEKDALVFEDDNCKIVYNLWSENGNIGFILYNKTDKMISINKNDCFFILNGVSYDYYQDRTFTKSSGFGISSSKGVSITQSSGTSTSGSVHYAKSETNLFNAAYSGIIPTETKGISSSYSNNVFYSETGFSSQSTTVSKGYSVSYKEPMIIHIPPKTAKIISEFQIVSNRYKQCDFAKHPANGLSSISFTRGNSPFTFSNRISYCIESSCTSPIIVENNFYVSEISNMAYDEFFTKDYEYSCGNKSDWKVLFRKHASPDKFYLIY